jgi:hypothetical protein
LEFCPDIDCVQYTPRIPIIFSAPLFFSLIECYDNTSKSKRLPLIRMTVVSVFHSVKGWIRMQEEE